MLNIKKMSYRDRLALLLDDIDLKKLKNGDESEKYRFYEKNLLFIRGIAWLFCLKVMKGNESWFEDLTQEIYLNLSDLDYRNYDKLCRSIRRVMFLYTMPDIYEKNCIRLDAPLADDDSEPSRYDKADKAENTCCTSDSDDKTLTRLVNWLRCNLTPMDFHYVCLRYINLATTKDIFRALGYSPFCDERNIDRFDYRIMQIIRGKYADLCKSVGGIFAKFKHTLPATIEKRKNIMTSFSLRPAR